VNAPKAVPAPRPTHVRQIVLAALLVITAVNYVQRNSAATAEKTIRAELRLTEQNSGDALAAFFLSYALFQIPAGWLAQRLGARLALSLYAGGWSLVIGLMALASGFTDLYVDRLLLGILQAGIFSCATLVLASWYPASRRGLATALLNSFMLIGAAVSSALTGLLLDPLGWRGVFALYALPGLAWAVWFAWWFRNDPRDHPGVNAEELALIAEDRDPAKKQEPPPDAPHGGIPWLAILTSIPLWLVLIQQGLRAGATRFYDNWMPTYFQEAHKATPAVAGILASVPLFAGIVGGVVGGAISDAILRRTRSRSLGRKGVAIASLLAGSLFFVLAYPIPNVWLATVVCSAGVFITTFAAPCAYALTLDLGGKNVGVVFAIMNTAGNLGATAFIAVVPRLKVWAAGEGAVLYQAVAAQSFTTPLPGAPNIAPLTASVGIAGRDPGGWDAVLLLFLGLHLAAALCWAFLNPEGVIGEPRSPSKSLPAKETT
jgi:ACS family glucarate transporter-like MFS transporter